MWTSEKGQVSFEILILTAIIFSSVIWVSGYYLEIKDSTLALQMTKMHAISRIGELDDAVVIKKLVPGEILSGGITIIIDIPGVDDPDLDCSSEQFDADTLRSDIMANTKFTTVNITLNGEDCI